MDTITAAIIAGLAGLSKDAINDSYNALKSALKNKFGSDSDLIDAVDKLEKKPDSQGRKVTLLEEVETASVNEDADLIKLAQTLLDKVKEQSSGQKNITVGNVEASGDGSVAIGNFEGQAGSIGGITNQAKK